METRVSDGFLVWVFDVLVGSAREVFLWLFNWVANDPGQAGLYFLLGALIGTQLRSTWMAAARLREAGKDLQAVTQAATWDSRPGLVVKASDSDPPTHPNGC